jgi:S-DNA-T family DNA segregation ATPase FtsK/SpoIIIE
MSDSQVHHINNPTGKVKITFSATESFNISQREPWELPSGEIEIPLPDAVPQKPNASNIMVLLIPPLILIISASLIYFLGKQSNLLLVLPMMLMGLVYPMVNLITAGVQKNKYKRALSLRTDNYRALLEEVTQSLNGLSEDQKKILSSEYPDTNDLVLIAERRHKRLWWRRTSDEDFLSFRVGMGSQPTSFNIKLPTKSISEDPLIKECVKVITPLQAVQGIPVLISLLESGSLSICSSNPHQLDNCARRIIFDIIVHHSPQDVEVALISDISRAVDKWGWMKWTPHTRALNPDYPTRNLCFERIQSEKFVKWLEDEYKERLRSKKTPIVISELKRRALIIFVEGSDETRKSQLFSQMAESGREVGIFLIFVGGTCIPRECRSKLEIDDEGNFVYLPTFTINSLELVKKGFCDDASLALCDKVSRSLAKIEVTSGKNTKVLPSSIRLSEVLGKTRIQVEDIKQRWLQVYNTHDQLSFPIGVRVTHNEIETALLDLKPEWLGGHHAFHTVLIGTTGSGKSVFLQSLILAAAYYYSPSLLNFMIMDFKGGASELSKLSDLPHVVGLVTDLSPDIAQRALIALASEIQRRKAIFQKAGGISDIWAYNERYKEDPIPQLVLVLDEFAKGVELLPDLLNTLESLATQGRALGIYLLLANQKVTSSVERLLANIGWKILLRVADKDEMRLIDVNLPRVDRPGRGYFQVKEEIVEFQGARSDQKALSGINHKVEKLEIFESLQDGQKHLVYSEDGTDPKENRLEELEDSELQYLLKLFQKTKKELGLTSARKIYLDPLPEIIHLQHVLNDSTVKKAFINGVWIESKSRDSSIIAPIGYMDMPGECRQELLEIDFSQKDGNVWIVGSTGSGKNQTLTSLLLSLCTVYSPDEVNIYCLDFGADTLDAIKDLPHIGSIIHDGENEKVRRLLSFIDNEFERRVRSGHGKDNGSYPHLFLVINNFGEFKDEHANEAEQVAHFLQGKHVGIHLIISTNRGVDLPRSISQNIARRIVLPLASIDEYSDLLKTKLPCRPQSASGRGFWVDKEPLECQIAQVVEPAELSRLVSDMQTKWLGRKPFDIQVIPQQISFTEMLHNFCDNNVNVDSSIPLGIEYETLQIFPVSLEGDSINVLLLGRVGSGKSNLLSCMVDHLRAFPDKWKLLVIAPRKSTLDKLKGNDTITIAKTQEEISILVSNIIETEVNLSRTKKIFLAIDDLEILFEPGYEKAISSLNELSKRLGDNVSLNIACAGTLDGLRSQQTAPFVKFIRQNKTGCIFSKDPIELDFMGCDQSAEIRKSELVKGRGFFINNGKPYLLQFPVNNG